jgi:hypothetical protein
MTTNMRASLATAVMLAMTLGLSSGCKESSTEQASASPSGTSTSSSTGTSSRSSHSLMSGTNINVTLGNTISSETASVGDAWHGTVTNNVEMQNGGMIPAGSEVSGVVTGAVGAKRGSRAMLDLGVRGIRVNGRDEKVTANGEAVIAGSTRARNLGAIAGGAAAGALIGKAVGDGKNAAVGGIIGGATAAGVVAGSKGYQVVLKDGSVMSFTVSQTVAMR